MSKSSIPGYDEALERERKIREEAFLSDRVSICGIEIYQVTPELLARLLRMSTPFLNGDVKLYSDSETIRFLWALSPHFSKEQWKRDEFWKLAFSKIGDEFGKAEDEIEEFVDDTFLDAPHSGRESVPYTCSIAWMVYKMASEPFRWDRDRTMRTPIREIYQYIRCDYLSKGVILRNAISDPVKEEWLASLPTARTIIPTGGNN